MAFKSPAAIVLSLDAAIPPRASFSTSRLLVLSFLAGAYIALGSLLALMVGGGLPGWQETLPGLQKFLFGAVFPVGLMAVVMCGAELVTGNMALWISPLLRKKVSWWSLGRNWGIVFVGNLIGSIFVAWFLAIETGLITVAPWADAIQAIALAKGNAPFWELFWKGVGCNWLVCLAVWMALAAEDVTSKMIAVWFPIMAFVAIGFEHCVANMFFIPAGIFAGAPLEWSGFWITNLVPVTLGNLVGGALFVGGLYGWLYGKE
ncbi:formate/nitrite transporter family protein [Chrysiogenes arsenatis]|uniref:formate/nitrite transporter family protein n=1 Tax=Chrysiogenes arsenatis TaxID=309797 RepID=UPI00042A236F|nr:formate/nitrite transporter family protein [Chrysiogenes arsenatis]